MLHLPKVGGTLASVPAFETFRQKDFERLAKEFLFRIAKNLFRPGIGHDDSSFRINKDYRIRRGLYDSTKFFLRLLQFFIRLMQFLLDAFSFGNFQPQAFGLGSASICGTI